MSTLRQDIKELLAGMRGTPTFFAAVILTLAVGIGANTAIFSIVRTVLLEPLPYPDPDRLVTISEDPWTPTEIVLDLLQSGDSFEQMAVYYPRRFAVTGAGQPYGPEGVQVTPDFFEILQAEMALGRDFVAADARPGAPRTVIVSHNLWQLRYGGSRDVLGRTIQIDGEIHEIIGVVERGFRLLAPRSENPELWIPSEIEPTAPDGSLVFRIPLGRLAPGASLQQAQSELDLVMTRFRENHPDADHPRWNLRLATLKSELVHNVRPALLVLQAAVAVVLLITCVNVANLLLARFSSRQKELAIRSALGASAGRLARKLLTEGVVLSLLGALAALMLILLGLKLLLALAPQDIPRLDQVSIDLAVLLFTLGISVVTGLVFGLIPALAGSRRPLYEFLKEGGRTSAGSLRKHRLSQALVITQVTLTLVLAVGAGLLVRSFLALAGQAPGFRTADVLTVRLVVPPHRYESVPQLEELHRRVLERLRQLPGVESIALSNNLPINRVRSAREYMVEGGADIETAAEVAQYGVVSPDCFRVLEIPLLRGRYFEESDRRGNLPVAIIDEAMADKSWPQQDPIGKRFRLWDTDWITVVGVVGNTLGGGLDRAPAPGFYIPYQQRADTPDELASGRTAFVLARVQTDVESLAEPLRRGIWEVDPQQPIAEIATLESAIAEEVSPQRFRAVLLGTFAAIALILVVTGIYGVVDYLVAERTHEFGIRMAMGATVADVVRKVLTWGLRLAAVGIVLGLVGVFALNRYLASLLFSVTPTDPSTVLVAVAAMLLVTLAACFIPTRRATRVDPAISLRSERQAAGETGRRG